MLRFEGRGSRFQRKKEQGRIGENEWLMVAIILRANNVFNYFLFSKLCGMNGYINYKGMNRFDEVSEDTRFDLRGWIDRYDVRDKNCAFEGFKIYTTDSEFTGRPNCRRQDSITNFCLHDSAVSSKQLKKGIIKLSVYLNFPSKLKVNTKHICQVRLVPKCDSYVVEVIYDKPESTFTNTNFVASIDLGLDNLVALTSNQPGCIRLLIDGRPLKSINQFYNKRSSRLQSQLTGNRKTSPRIQRLTR